MSEDTEGARRRTATSHQVGEDLSRLSGDELRERLVLLGEETARVQRELEQKEGSLAAAENVFTRRSGN